MLNRRAFCLILALGLLLTACNLMVSPTPTDAPAPTLTATRTLERVLMPTLPPPLAPSDTPPPPPQTGILFLGDSITEGWDVAAIYPSAINAGNSGDTTGQVLSRFQQQYATRTYDAAVLLVGINDIASGVDDVTLRNNLLILATGLETVTSRIVVGSVLPVSDRYDPSVHRRILVTNAWLRDLAAGLGFSFVDFYSAMSDANGIAVRGYFVDGLHPSPVGYEVMTSVLSQVLAP